jgi:hypothetical protein
VAATPTQTPNTIDTIVSPVILAHLLRVVLGRLYIDPHPVIDPPLMLVP